MAEKKVKARLNELRGMGAEDLSTVAEAARKNIYTITRQRISKPMENVKAIRTSRKEIARVETILRQREIAADAQSAK
jgi:ribosomal protein L29